MEGRRSPQSPEPRPAQEEPSVQERLALIEGQLQTLTNLMQAFYDDRDSLRTLLQNVLAASATGHAAVPVSGCAPPSAVSPVPGPSQPQQPDSPLPDDPIYWQEDWSDDGQGREPPKEADEDAEERKKTCGVCHTLCRKSVKVLIPCGHMPFCAKCVDQMQAQCHDRNDGVKLYCPICQQPSTDAITHKPLHPYRDTVANI